MNGYGPPPRLWRAGLLLLVFICLFGVLGFRLHHLQIEEGGHLANIAERQRVRTWVLPASRGSLFDASGAPIAVSQSSWTLTCDPKQMTDRLRATIEISRIVPELNRDELRAQFECGKDGRTLRRGLNDDQAKAVIALKLIGVELKREFSRNYPGGVIAPHVVGFINTDGKGAAGIEQTLDARLAGTDGKETLQIDGQGRPIMSAGGTSVAAIPGSNVQLTIDVAVQEELETVLDEAGTKHRPIGIAGLVIRPSTGEIVAMASWPSFDLSNRATFSPEAVSNRAVQMVYEPGSTMKPLVAGAAVSEGLTTFQESIFCEHGRWTYHLGKSSRTISDHSFSSGGHGNLTVTEGIALSDNILMAKLGLRLGPARLHDWVSSFRFGHKLGICLPGEGAGIMGAKSAWNQLGACMSVPMGHEIAVTPLQLAMAHAGIANRGQWNPPTLVKRIWTDGEAGIKELPLPPNGERTQIFSDAHAAEIEQAMTHTMTEGTGKDADLDGYIAAGKTGTTMKLVDGKYSETHHVGSFVCWAPAQPSADVREKLLCLISVDDPSQNGYYGAEVAAPYVQKVLQFALEHDRVPKVVKAQADKSKTDRSKRRR